MKDIMGWRDASKEININYSLRRPKFGSKYPHDVTTTMYNPSFVNCLVLFHYIFNFVLKIHYRKGIKNGIIFLYSLSKKIKSKHWKYLKVI